MNENPRKRSVALKITITPALHADLVRVAEALGQTPATLASVAVGQYVAAQRRSLDSGGLFLSELAGQVGPELADGLRKLLETAPEASGGGDGG